MKTKETLDPKFLPVEKLNTKSKPKSLRPMRSMIAVRSLKPRTGVATLAVRNEEMTRN
jgi:hypothetical protein